MRRLSRRAKAAIYLRADVETRLSARRATQAERERQYRSRQARSIHAATVKDALLNRSSFGCDTPSPSAIRRSEEGIPV